MIFNFIILSDCTYYKCYSLKFKAILLFMIRIYHFLKRSPKFEYININQKRQSCISLANLKESAKTLSTFQYILYFQ